MSRANQAMMWVSRIFLVAVVASWWGQNWLAHPDQAWWDRAFSVIALLFVECSAWIGQGVIWQDDWPRKAKR